MTLILRIAVAFILLMHSIPGMLNGGVNDFGIQYLNEVGFAPCGLVIAWAIKLSHVVCTICLLANKFIWQASTITIFILLMGIIMIHYKEGWFVVGGGRNGMEFNFLLIMVLIYLTIEERYRLKNKI